MEVISCSMHVKNSTKVGLSVGGGIQLDFLLKGGVLSWILLRKKFIVLACVSWTYSRIYLFLVYRFWWGVEQKDKPLVRTENSSSFNVWLERLSIMFWLYWEVYVLMDLVMNLRNEDLHWFYGKKNFIGGGIYVNFNGDVGSRVTFSVFVWFWIFWCRCAVE